MDLIGTLAKCVCVYYCRTFYKAVRVGEEEMDLKKKGKKAVVAWAWRLSQKLSCATFPQAGCSAMAAPWRS